MHGTVAKQAFVSITVARQQGNRTPFRFFIPELYELHFRYTALSVVMLAFLIDHLRPVPLIIT
jgi:hypothetical protein